MSHVNKQTKQHFAIVSLSNLSLASVMNVKYCLSSQAHNDEWNSHERISNMSDDGSVNALFVCESREANSPEIMILRA